MRVNKKIRNQIKFIVRSGAVEFEWLQYRSLLNCLEAIFVYDYDRSMSNYIEVIITPIVFYKNDKNELRSGFDRLIQFIFNSRQRLYEKDAYNRYGLYKSDFDFICDEFIY